MVTYVAEKMVRIFIVAMPIPRPNAHDIPSDIPELNLICVAAVSSVHNVHVIAIGHAKVFMRSVRVVWFKANFWIVCFAIKPSKTLQQMNSTA